MDLTTDPNLTVKHRIVNGDKIQVTRTKPIHFSSSACFSLCIEGDSPFVGGAKTHEAVANEEKWLVDAKFQRDAKDSYEVAIYQAAAIAAQSQTATSATPQVEVILEQY